jgi:hypothetical protein
MTRGRRHRWFLTFVAIAILFAMLVTLATTSVHPAHGMAWTVLVVLLFLGPPGLSCFSWVSLSTRTNRSQVSFDPSRFQRPPPASTN